ncbi:MAG: Ig-like domain-containing protein, partial [Cyclobacteriaceae bacterium]
VSGAFGQVSDNFSDGNFTTDPTWTGTTTNFLVENEILKLNAAEAGESFLTTPNNLTDNVTWKVDLTMDFNPSSTNRTFIYLMTDQSDLQGSLTGYYIMVGNTSDEISLYRQDGAVSTKIIDGTDDVVDIDPVAVNIRVTRDASGNWSLYHNVGESGEVLEGTVLDNTYTNTSFFGVLADYTPTRSDRFTFDNISVGQNALAIDTIIATANNQLEIRYNQNVEETSAENPANYSLDNGITVTSAVQDAIDKASVILTTDQPLPSDNYELTVTGVADALSGNPTANPITASFTYSALEIEEIVTTSATEVRIEFNQTVEETSAETVTNYTINPSIGNPVSVVRDDINNDVVTLTLGTALADETAYTVDISGVQNTIGNSTFNGTSSEFQFVVPLLADTLFATSANEVRIVFNKDIDPATANVSGNYLLNNTLNPQTTTIINDRTVSLSFASDFAEGINTVDIIGVQNADNSLTANNLEVQFQYQPMEIISITPVSDNEVIVLFNQPVDSISARMTANYTVNFGIGNPNLAIFDKDSPEQVTLAFADFANNKYELTIDGVSNRSENASLNNAVATFSIFRATPAMSILINEIFPDPTPSVGLPSSEFAELYNRSADFINLEGFDFSGGTLPDYTLAPNTFVILTSSGNISDYETFGNAISVSSFPTLVNSGRELVLKDNLGNTLDSINYDVTWYRDEEKANGGFSLELINPELACSGSFNWIASLSATGGTPGNQNSVFDDSPDTKAPEIIRVEVVTPDSLIVSFSETIESGSVSPADFSLEENDVIAATAIDGSLNSIALKLETPLNSGEFFTLTATNIRDCSGNTGPDSFAFFYDATPPEILSVIINSKEAIVVRFSEAIDETSAETEPNYFANKGLGEPSSAIRDEFILTDVLLNFGSELINDTIYTLTLANISDTSGNVLSSATVNFQFEQSIDSVGVIAANIIEVYFNQPVEKTSSENIDNFFLESLEMPLDAARDEQDNSIVRLVFDGEINDNSERSLFVRNIKSIAGDPLSTPEFVFIYDTRAPSLVDAQAIDSTQLLITFTEPVKESSAEINNHYELNDDVFPDSVVLQANDSMVIAYFSEPFPKEETQQITVRNVQDLFGNFTSSTTNRRLDFVYDPLPPSLIRLIQLSADSVLLNYSEPIDEESGIALANYNFSSGITVATASFILGDSSKILLLLTDDLPETTDQLLTISNIADRNGNQIEGPIIRDFNRVNPEVSLTRFIDPRTLRITFSKPIAEEQLIATGNYTTENEPAVISAEAVNTKTVDLGFAEDLTDDQTIDIEISENLVATNGSPLITKDLKVTFDDRFEGIFVISENTIALEFSLEIARPEASAFQVVGDMSQPQIVGKDVEDPEIIRLVFGEAIPENSPLVIRWTGITDLFGNPIPNGAAEFTIDTNAPRVISATPVLLGQINLAFSEKLEEVSATATNHYQLRSNRLIPIRSLSFEEDSIVSLAFSQNLTDGETYSLKVIRVQDLSGNTINDTTINFVFDAPELAQSGDILITEIMADPTPPVGLPEVEYIELYNASEKSFDLSTMMIGDRSVSRTLPAYELLPQAYVILTGTQNEILFEEEAVAVSGFPSLGNSFDSIGLKNFQDEIIDAVSYDISWYNDADKDDGGYSLERISLLDVCNTEANWTASDASEGGTPGKINSVFDNSPDTESPEIISFAISDNELAVIFSEPMDTNTFVASSFSFVPEIQVTDISASQDRLNAVLNATFEEGISYRLTISGVTDCSGNLLLNNELTFGQGKSPAFGELIITEIMADPEPSQGLP